MRRLLGLLAAVLGCWLVFWGLVGSHPDVIRHPDEVDSRSELWR